jgi:RNA polymerase sigma factor (sigma-70 family)
MSSKNTIFNPGHVIDPIEQRKKQKNDNKDIQLLAKRFIEDHSEKNFNALMKRCSWGLRTYIFGMTGSKEDTENILNITMEHVYFRIDSFKDDVGKFSTWMYRIAHNDTVTYFRSGGYKSKINTVNIDLSDVHERIVSSDEGCTFDDMLSDEEIENMSFDGKEFNTYTKSKVLSDIYDASIECMGYLPDHLRIVMKERYINKKKVDTIAEENKISSASVKNWIRKGCSELANEIKNRNKELYNIFDEMRNK